MKILLVGEGMDIGGCETHIYELARALSSRGHEVVLLSSGGCYAERLLKEGVRTVTLPTNRRDPLSLFRCVFGLMRLLREGFDVVHTHTRGMSLLIHYLYRGAKVSTVHLDFRTTKILRRICRFGERTLAVSRDIGEYLIREYKINEKQILYTYNGIDTEHFGACRKGHGIVHLSRLDKDRSLTAHLLCEIAPSILAENKTRKIHIFGDGDDMSRVKKSAERANLALGYEGVILHGATSDIREALALGDIFVGVSRAALEAMAAGRAVLISGNDGYGGILTNENAEKLRESNFCARGFEKAKARRLAIDLLALIRHEDIREECAHFGRELSSRYYAREGMAEDAERAYREAIEEIQGRTLLVGYFGYGNFGDNLTLQEFSKLLKNKTVYLPTTGEVSLAEGNDDARLIPVGRFFGAFGALFHVRTVIFGGGTLFQNATSNRSLFYYSLIALLARWQNKRLLMLGGGIDEIKGTVWQTLTKRALSSFDILALRSEKDKKRAESLLKNGRAIYLPDISFLRVVETKAPLAYVVFTLDGTREHSGVEEVIVRVRAAGLSVVLLPLFQRADAPYLRRLSKKAGARMYTNLTEGQILSLLSRACFVISERLHGAIGALLCHKACFLCVRSQKQRGLYEDVSALSSRLGYASPILPFLSYGGITKGRILQAKKEAAGKSYGFGKIIQFYRNCIKEQIMPLLEWQAFPWEPSSLQREQQRQQGLSLPWTSHEHLP